MGRYPGSDGTEIRFCGAGVEDVARSMAVVDCVVLCKVMGLALEHADSVV